jgi:hypothetical protein
LSLKREAKSFGAPQKSFSRRAGSSERRSALVLKELARRAHLAAHRGRSTRDRRGTRSGRARRTRDVDFMAAKPYTLCARAPSPRRRRRRRLQNDRSIERAIDRPTHDAMPPPPPPPPPRSTTTVPYLTAADANAVCTTLSVDNELQPDKVEKTLRVDGASLVACVRFPRFSPRFLRANIRVARGRTGGSARPFPLRSRESDLTTTSSRPRHSRSSPETSRRPSRGSCAPRSPRSWTSSTSRRARSKSSAPCPPNFRQSRERPRERPAARTSRRAETLDTTRP